MNDPKVTFSILGLLVGIIGVVFSPLEAFIILLLAAVGWIIGKYAAGEMEFIDVFLGRFFSNRLGRPKD